MSSKPGKGLRNRTLMPLALMAGTTIGLCADEGPTTAFEWDVKFVEKLNKSYTEVNFLDLALEHLTGMEGKYQQPAEIDRVNLLRATIFLNLQQQKSFQEAIGKIKATSPLYPESRIVLARSFWAKGDMKAAIATYEQYFKLLPKPPKDQAGIGEWKNAILASNRLYENTGQTKKALDILEKVKLIPGNQDTRQIDLLKASSLLRAEDGKASAGKKIDKKLIQQAQKLLKKNTWTTDYTAAVSFVELAHSYCLSGKPLEAIKTIRMASGMLKNIEKAIPKSQISSDSPVAGALYYGAVAYELVAHDFVKDNKADKAKQLLSKGIAQIDKLRKRYAESKEAEKALLLMAKYKETMLKKLKLAEKDLPALLTSKTGEFMITMKKAKELYMQKKFAQAEAEFAKAVEGAPVGPETEEAYKLLIGSMLQNVAGRMKDGKFPQVEDIIKKLDKDYPRTDDTITAYLRLGQAYFGKSREAGLSDEQVGKFKDSAFKWFDKFVTYRPMDEKAAQLSRLVAENDRVKYLNALKAARAFDDKDKREQAENDAVSKLRQLIGRYEGIVESYPDSSEATFSLQKIGEIYQNIGDADNAAKYYLQYVATETDPSKEDLKLKVKFNAASQMLKTEDPIKSVSLFKEVVGAIDAKSANADLKKLHENGMNAMGVAYSIVSNKYDQQVLDIDKQVRENYEELKNSKAQLREAQDAVKSHNKTKVELTSVFTNEKESLKGLDFESWANKGKSGKTGIDNELEMKNKRRQFNKIEKQRIAGEKGRLKSLLVPSEKEAKGLETILNDADLSVQTNTNNLKLFEGRLERRQKKLAKSKESLKKSEVKLNAERAKLDAARKEVREAEKVFRATFDKEQKAELEKGLQEHYRKIGNVKADYDIVKRKYSEKEAEIYVESRALKAELAELTQKKADAEKAIKVNSRILKVGKERLEYLKLQQATLKDALDKNALDAKVLAGSKTVKDQKEAIKKSIKSLVSARKQQVKWLAVKEAQAKQDVVDLGNDIKGIETLIAKLGEDRKPLKTKSDQLKRIGVKYYDEFLKAYPNSADHAANAYAIAGGIYAGFGDFQKAAGYQKKLKEKYPAHPAVKTSVFSLGKAYMELGKYKQAKDVFEKDVLKQAQNYTAGNLVFIQRQMLEVFDPAKPETKAMLDVSTKAGIAVLSKANKDAKLKPMKGLIYKRLIDANYAKKSWDGVIRYTKKLIDHKRNSRYKFDAQLKCGLAFREKKQYDRAQEQFMNVYAYAGKMPDPTLKAKAMYESAKTELMIFKGKGEDGRNKMRGIASKLMLVTDMIKAGDEELATMHQKAMHALTVAQVRLGDKDLAKQTIAKYNKFYPQGKLAGKLKSALSTAVDLPAPKPVKVEE